MAWHIIQAMYYINVLSNFILFYQQKKILPHLKLKNLCMRFRFRMIISSSLNYVFIVVYTYKDSEKHKNEPKRASGLCDFF